MQLNVHTVELIHQISKIHNQPQKKPQQLTANLKKGEGALHNFNLKLYTN